MVRKEKNRPRPPFLGITRLLWIICAGTWFCTLGALAGQYISPARTLIPAYLGLAFPIVIALQLFALGATALLQRWRLFGISLIVLALAYPSVKTYIPLNKRKPIRQEAAPSADTLRVLSLNVQAFIHRETKDKRHNPAVQYINKSNAHIVCLQEAFLGNDSKRTVTESNIRKLCPNYPYVKSLNAQHKDGSRLAILSKYPIKAALRLPLDSRFNGAARFQIELPQNRDLVLYNVHLESFKITHNDRQEYSNVTRDILGVTEKMHIKLAPAFRLRAKQVQWLEKRIKEEDSPYIIVCGDFNDSPISYTRRRLMRAGVKDSYRAVGYGPGFSFYTSKFAVRLDQMLASPAFIPITAYVDKRARVSDHKPLVVTFQYKDPAPTPQNL